MKFFRGRDNPPKPEFQIGEYSESELRHLESETRLPDVSNDFQERLIAAGGEIKIPERLVRDTRYAMPSTNTARLNLDLPAINLNRATSHQELVKVLRYAGFTVVEPGYVDHFTLTGYNDPGAERLVRVRQEGDRLTLGGTFEVKGPKVKQGAVKKRPEYGAGFNDITALIRALDSAGFKQSSYFEKRRVTLNFNGCKVEVDICPITEIGQWAEVEGQSDVIAATLDKIKAATGYNVASARAVGQREFIAEQVKEKKLQKKVDLNNIRFQL